MHRILVRENYVIISVTEQCTRARLVPARGPSRASRSGCRARAPPAGPT